MREKPLRGLNKFAGLGNDWIKTQEYMFVEFSMETWVGIIGGLGGEGGKHGVESEQIGAR